MCKIPLPSCLMVPVLLAGTPCFWATTLGPRMLYSEGAEAPPRAGGAPHPAAKNPSHDEACQIGRTMQRLQRSAAPLRTARSLKPPVDQSVRFVPLQFIQ